ncbi:MAG: hypothetical protein PF569_01550 [Candidatus Woesearchaeota archaeon]|jgi:hypothetical protein|nr:hypothetical protein [Candidatus Woesearchaeota archaeon]
MNVKLNFFNSILISLLILLSGCSLDNHMDYQEDTSENKFTSEKDINIEIPNSEINFENFFLSKIGNFSLINISFE